MGPFDVLRLCAILALSAGCSPGGSDDQRDSEGAQVVGQTVSDTVLSQSLESKFVDLAPSDWKLHRAHETSASFDVELAGKVSGEPIIVRGAVLLDGRFERYLSSSEFSPAVIARARENFGAVPDEYPKVDGFEVVVDTNSLGFDSSRGIQRRSIKYLNRYYGVFCLGTNPGRLRCLWGTPENRILLNFHSDQTVPALEYIKRKIFK